MSLVLAVLLLSTSATPAPMAAGIPPAPAAPAEAAPPHFGLMVDAGLPSGAGLSAVYRPVRFLRLSLGGGYNAVSGGIKGAVDLVPFWFAITPSLHLEAGHFFEGDALRLARRFANVSSDVSPLLRAVGYDYATAQVGFEVGSPRGFVFFLRAGLAWMWGSAYGTATASASDGTRVQVSDPTVRLAIPSAQLGFIYYVH